jgi:uncharacterized damage-inducible protein DinB
VEPATGQVNPIELMKHMAWADATLWEAVLRSAPARADPRIRRWLHHIHTVQRAFGQVWRDESPSFRELSEFPDARSLCRWGREGLEECQVFVARATAETYARQVRFPWAAEIAQTLNRPICHPTLGQAVTQLAMHSAHHRGQVNAWLRDLGGEPPTIDFIVWLWLGQPEAPWSFLDHGEA